jgi:hypothetical protein
MTEVSSRGNHLRNTNESHQHNRPRTILWIAALVVFVTFLVLDAAAVAWSASWINGRQVTVELFTFFVVVSGAAVTVWKMKAN